VNYIEWSGTFFGLICVILTVRQNIWCWPTGLLQVLLYIFVFYEARLYSDMILHIIYVILQIYGWWAWLYGSKDHGKLPVSRIKITMALVWAAVAIFGSFVVGFMMHCYTNAALPYWDACIMVLSLIAQYLMARKILESWIIWIVVDVLALGVYSVKGLYTTTGLYGVFLVLSILGLLSWKKTICIPARD
jgi:nicotinamide mononucleotide transporter